MLRDAAALPFRLPSLPPPARAARGTQLKLSLNSG